AEHCPPAGATSGLWLERPGDGQFSPKNNEVIKLPMQHVITDDLEALLATLPPDIHDAVNRLDNRSELLDIVLDLGRQSESRLPEGEVIISTTPVSYADLEYVVERIGEFGDDNRAGIERTLHRISSMRNRKGRVVGLTCRIGRAVLGSIALI